MNNLILHQAVITAHSECNTGYILGKGESKAHIICVIEGADTSFHPI